MTYTILPLLPSQSLFLLFIPFHLSKTFTHASNYRGFEIATPAYGGLAMTKDFEIATPPYGRLAMTEGEDCPFSEIFP